MRALLDPSGVSRAERGSSLIIITTTLIDQNHFPFRPRTVSNYFGATASGSVWLPNTSQWVTKARSFMDTKTVHQRGDLCWQVPLSELLVTLVSIELHLLAISNSLRWFLYSVLQIPSDFFESMWQELVDGYVGKDGNQMPLLVTGTLLVSTVVYWLWGSIYIVLDLTGWLSRYKVQPGTNQPIDSRRLTLTVLQVLLNQTVVALPVAMAAFHLAAATGRLLPLQDLREVPPFSRVLLEMPFLVLCHEFAFYYSHRFLHHKWLYRTIHKRHHQWTAPVAVVALDCHPLEHILSNVGPVLLGPAILGSHPLTAWFWFSYVTFQTLNGHSGYHWPFFQSPEFHDYHHLKFNQNYGSIGLLDYLHHTDTQWRDSVQFKRHFVLNGLESVNEIVPESKTKSL